MSISLQFSKDLSDYAELKLGELRPVANLCCELFLYFESSKHIVLWVMKGDGLSEDLLSKARARKLVSVRVRKEDEADIRAQLGLTQKPAAAVERAPRPSPPVAEKQQAVARQAQATLGALGASGSPHAARKVVEEILAAEFADPTSPVAELWKLASLDPESGHAINVATYATLFALAFGRIDQALLSDIALAGLLHDVGISQVAATAARLPLAPELMCADPAAQKEYETHVDRGVALVRRIAPSIPERVLSLISEHHEKFSGTGFPRSLKGFKINDIAQLVSMADMVDSIASGKWDGEKRAFADTLEMVKKLSGTRNFPEHFNPDLLAAILKWMKSDAATDGMEAASNTVEAHAQDMIRGKTGA